MSGLHEQPGIDYVHSSIITLDQEELILNIKTLLRSELDAFATRFGAVAAAAKKGHQKPMGQQSSRAGRHHSTPEEMPPAPHAWVGRSIRSYAAAAEIVDLEGLAVISGTSSMRSPDRLLPEVIPKGAGPLSMTRRRHARVETTPHPVDAPVREDSLFGCDELPLSSQRSAPTQSSRKDSHRSEKSTRSVKSHFSGTSQSSRKAVQAWSERKDSRVPSYPMPVEHIDSLGSGAVHQFNSNISVVPQPEKAGGKARNALSPLPQSVAPPEGAGQQMPQDQSWHLSQPQHLPRDSSQVSQLPSIQSTSSPPKLGDGALQVPSGPSAKDVNFVDVDEDNESELTDRTGASFAEGLPQNLLKRMSTIYSTMSMQMTSSSVKASRRLPWSRTRVLVYSLVRNLYFENITMLFILANSLTIGLQTDYSARMVSEEGPIELRYVNGVIAVFFTAELLLRMFAFRFAFFTMPSWRWNIVDLVVVSLQTVEEIMSALALEKSNLPVALGLLRMVRILRLVRIIRVVRLLKYMSELRTIVVSITSSMKPLCSAILLLVLVVYIVGIYFTQLTLDYRIDNEGSAAAEELKSYFGSVGTTVMGLFQTVTGGMEWRNMVTPLMEHISPWTGLVFAFYIVFTSLALMNIVTGVFVETALQRGREDKDVYMINHLKDLFGALDENRSGTISWSELVGHLDNPKLIAFFKDIDIDISEAKGLFQLLDRDGSGTIDADEFLSGCLRLRGPAKALDLQLVMLELAEQRRTFLRLSQYLEPQTEQDEADFDDG